MSHYEKLKLDFPYSIDVVSALKTKADFNLSDFGARIDYIPLKGLPEAPISFILNVEITDDNIFVFASHQTGVLRYTRDGELLRHSEPTKRATQFENLNPPKTGYKSLVNCSLQILTNNRNYCFFLSGMSI